MRDADGSVQAARLGRSRRCSCLNDIHSVYVLPIPHCNCNFALQHLDSNVSLVNKAYLFYQVCSVC